MTKFLAGALVGIALFVSAAGAVVHFADLRITEDSGPATSASIAVPDVRGMPLSAARRTLEASRLGWSVHYNVRTGEQAISGPPGSRMVRGQDPPPGANVDPYTLIELDIRPK